MTNIKRRKFLKITGAAGVGMIGYSLYAGLRFPPLQLNITPTDKQRTLGNQHVSVTDAIFMPQLENKIHLRAFAPEPKINIESKEAERIQIRINNIHPDSKISAENAIVVSEAINGITRDIVCDVNKNAAVELEWKFADSDHFEFAAIGDSGGGPELDWCIQRAHELGAKFLLHLGDFNYMDGDYVKAINKFYNAPLPCYVTIGNHDFHDDGSIYKSFQEEIGALNNQFKLGGIRFANIDTAANFFPPGSGHRGELMKALIADKGKYIDTVVFTHRPLKDPRPNESHDIGGVGEIEWFAKALNEAGIDKLLCGHIHIQAEVEYDGILNLIAGQGLGHQDLVAREPISKILLGTVAKGQKVSYRWGNLNMPVLMHCSDHNMETLEKTGQTELKKQIEEACKN